MGNFTSILIWNWSSENIVSECVSFHQHHYFTSKRSDIHYLLIIFIWFVLILFIYCYLFMISTVYLLFGGFRQVSLRRQSWRHVLFLELPQVASVGLIIIHWQWQFIIFHQRVRFSDFLVWNCFVLLWNCDTEGQ